jgi:hypothetical protein
VSIVVDRVLVTVAIALSLIYACKHLAPRALNMRLLSALAAALAVVPAALGGRRLQARLGRALDRLATPSGCGGCGSCASDGKETAASGGEQRISPDSIGRRTR